jgi:nitronate monooxygenase
VAETAGSNPAKWIGMFKAAGLITIHKCVAVRHALSAERAGVDIVKTPPPPPPPPPLS